MKSSTDADNRDRPTQQFMATVVVLIAFVSLILVNLLLYFAYRDMQKPLGAGSTQIGAEQGTMVEGNDGGAFPVEDYLDEEYVQELDIIATALCVNPSMFEDLFPGKYAYMKSKLYGALHVIDSPQVNVVLPTLSAQQLSSELAIKLDNQSTVVDLAEALDECTTEVGIYEILTKEQAFESASYQEDAYKRLVTTERYYEYPHIITREFIRDDRGRDSIMYIIKNNAGVKYVIMFDVFTNGSLNSYNIYR